MVSLTAGISGAPIPSKVKSPVPTTTSASAKIPRSVSSAGFRRSCVSGL